MIDRDILKNIEQCIAIEDEALEALCARTGRRLFSVCIYDGEGELVLMGLTSAQSLEEAQKRAPLAEVRPCLNQTVRFEDDEVHYLI